MSSSIAPCGRHSFIRYPFVDSLFLEILQEKLHHLFVRVNPIVLMPHDALDAVARSEIFGSLSEEASPPYSDALCDGHTQ
jgi:hypothetical protein